MARANDSFERAPDASGGTLLATHAPGDGKEYPVFIPAEPDGHLQGSKAAYGFVVPPQAVGANKIYFDVFNTQAATSLHLRKLFAIVATDVAVAGTVAVRLDTFRTTSIGTAGTAFSADSASTTGATFWKFDPGQAALPAGVTGRMTPTGGATSSTWLWHQYVMTEEGSTAQGSSTQMTQFFNLIPELPFHQPIVFPTNYGFALRQGTVASVGNIGFLGVFTIEQ